MEMSDYLISLGAAAAESSSAGLAEQFGINAKFLVAQILNFCLVAFILYRFAFKPVLKTIEERQAKIADGLQYAEEMKSKLAESERKEAETLRQAHREAQRIVAATRENSKAILEKHTQEAVARADGILKKAEHSIGLERNKMLSEVQEEIVGLVVRTTEKVLKRDLSERDRASYSESAARELAEVE